MLEKALTTVRRTGYAVSIEEAARTSRPWPAPIFDGSGECVAAVSVAGPITRIPQEQLDKLARIVLAAAASVSSTSAQSA